MGISPLRCGLFIIYYADVKLITQLLFLSPHLIIIIYMKYIYQLYLEAGTLTGPGKEYLPSTSGGGETDCPLKQTAFDLI
jgi:hypothetical protein